MNILILVGSLRAGSYNAALAHLIERELPAGSTATRFDRLAELPFYSEDAEETFPPVVAEFRNAVAAADALVVVTPEYNGATSAILKNAIDVASRPRAAASLSGKPVAILGASVTPYGAQFAREGLVRVLQIAGAQPIEQTVGIPAAHDALVGGEFVNAAHREAVADLLSRLSLPVAA